MNSKVHRESVISFSVMSMLFAVSVMLFASSATAQVVDKETAVASAVKPAAIPAASAPLINDVKGVSIGMTADEVKAKLGDPTSSGAGSMFYDLDGGQTIQLRFDADKKVTIIASVYTGDQANPPKVTDVFGPEVKIDPAENGSVYKLVRYPSAGVWIAYSRLNAGGDPITSVTINKISQ